VESTIINISDIVIDPAFQMRCTLSEDAVSDYSEVITSTNAEWPFSTPCSVYRVSGQMILTDGFHRLAAMQKAGRDAIRATVTDGTRTDALIASLGANHSHGLRRSNADKRRAVQMALADDLLSSMSDRELSTLCGVSHPLVGQIRGELETVTTSPVTRTGADGKSYPASKASQVSQREKIAAAVTADDSVSDRQIAEQMGCDHKTVAGVRRGIANETQITRVDDEDESDNEPDDSFNETVVDREAIDVFIDITDSIRRLLTEIPPLERANIWDQVMQEINAEDITKWSTQPAGPDRSGLSDKTPAPFDAIKSAWEATPEDDQPELRQRVAELVGLVEPEINGGKTLFPKAAAAKISVGRKKPTEAEFEAFWQAYPRRTEKGNAKRAFEKAFTNLREQYSIAEVIEKIMSGVDAYAENADPDYLCHPATWLNGCRWDDEPASIGKVKKKSHSDFGKFDEATADEPW